MRLLLAIIATLCLAFAPAAFAADPLEGRWQINGGGALVDIVASPGTDGSLAMLWVDGEDFSIPAGEQIATIYPAANAGTYDCSASTDPRNRGKKKGREVSFVIRFTNGSTDALEFEAYQSKRRVSLWRWIPYLFRVTVITKNNRPSDLEGARRVGAPQKFITL